MDLLKGMVEKYYKKIGIDITVDELIVTIAGSEIVGLVPMAALVDTAEYYLGIEDFSMQQVLESRIMEE